MPRALAWLVAASAAVIAPLFAGLACQVGRPYPGFDYASELERGLLIATSLAEFVPQRVRELIEDSPEAPSHEDLGVQPLANVQRPARVCICYTQAAP